MKQVLWAGVVLWTLATASVFGSGMLIPKDESLPPLAIKHQRVEIAIKDGVATAKIEQVFKNSVDRDLEAVYVFPLPENASIADFAMYINGKRTSGELVEKDKARQIYQDIVRRLKDPGLLEYIGGNLFRVSVYPVPKQGEQRIELQYSQTLKFDAGLYGFVYPLKTGEQASRTLEDFTVSARLSSSVPIKSVYSPTHAVGITRKGDHEAVIGFEENRALLDRDFALYYSVSEKEFGLNLLSHAAKGEDGFFMMMLAPGVELPGKAVIRKDVAFVVDTSGSMSGRKIEQARGALKYCVNRLNDGDRFNLIRFSTDVDPFNDGLVPANDGNRREAIKYVELTEARGGTAIDAALTMALNMDYQPDRAHIVVFLTDGKPTIGETDTEAILANVKKANKKGARIFVFGVGDEVNTHLLDELAGANGGLSRYVKPDEDLEVPLSSFADKMSRPVLSNVRIQADKISLSKVYPAALPDLFSGDQLTVFGRYEGSGHVALRLLGEVNGQKREWVYEDTFPKANAENTFIPRLWATRRVGHLLDEIRLHGEERELKDEVIRLSKDYGIMTPYTSYLVLEDDQAYQQRGIDRVQGAKAAPAKATRAVEVFAKRAMNRSTRPMAGSSADASAAPAETVAPAPAMVPMFQGLSAGAAASRAPSRRSGDGYRRLEEGTEDVRSYLRQDSGAKAVELSEAIGLYKERETAGEDIATVRHVGSRVFSRLHQQWVDSRYKEGMKALRLTFGSREYFEFLDKHPDLGPVFALGDSVIVVLNDGTAVIVEPAEGGSTGKG